MPDDAPICERCGAKHRLDQPHNLGSPLYVFYFVNDEGRMPTWADAMDHCTPEVKAAWKKSLLAKGAWTEPTLEDMMPPMNMDDVGIEETGDAY